MITQWFTEKLVRVVRPYKGQRARYPIGMTRDGIESPIKEPWETNGHKKGEAKISNQRYKMSARS